MTEGTRVKVPKKKMIKVCVITYGSSVAVVEYQVKGHLDRVILPNTDVIGDTVEESVLEAGLPYGVPWEAIEIPTYSSQDVADELHKHGIWTPEDALSRVATVQGAVANVTGKLVSRILELASKTKAHK